jgi:hypothetical protein
VGRAEEDIRGVIVGLDGHNSQTDVRHLVHERIPALPGLAHQCRLIPEVVRAIRSHPEMSEVQQKLSLTTTNEQLRGENPSPWGVRLRAPQRRGLVIKPAA